MSTVVRFLAMLALLAGGYAWLRPRAVSRVDLTPRFVERAAAAGCRNVHTLCRLHEDFANVMPWLSSVGAAAAAADYDGDGDADLYVTNCGRGDSNHLYRNRGDGTFEDVTTTAGVACPNVEGASMHAIWGDIDNDGDLDLYVTKWGAKNTLYFNNGDGTFRTTTSTKQPPPAPPYEGGEGGVDCWGYANAATFLDYDRDGRLDILVANYFSETVVDPRTGQLVRNDLWHPVSTKIMHETFTHARNGGTKHLYRNRGDGTFEDVAKQVGLTTTYWTLAVGAGDLNNDGWPDLYLANDFGPDEYYLNTGATESPPRYRLTMDPRGHPGIGSDWWKGMNVDMGDVNNDGYLDLYVTNILSRRYKTDEGNMLWINCPDALCPGGRGFMNLARQAGPFDGGWGWGGKFADFNLDGRLDIFTVNGFVTGSTERNYWFAVQEMVTQTKNQTVDARDWPPMGDRDLSGREPSRLFMQTPPKPGASPRDVAFVDLAEAAGVTDTFNGRGIALADYDLNGTIDLYVANQGEAACYYVNLTHRDGTHSDSHGLQNGKPLSKDFLRIRLIGRPDAPVRIGARSYASTRDAVGARVTLHAKGAPQMREVQGGQGFASQSEYALHFGVPDADAVERLTVSWPSGRTQEWTGPAVRGWVGHHLELVELGEPKVLR